MNDEALIATISAIGGLLTIITGYLLKAHINKSACCGGYGCECVCDPHELEAVNTVKRIKTERKRRESQQIISTADIMSIASGNSGNKSISSNNNDVFIPIEQNIKELEETIKGEKQDSIV